MNEPKDNGRHELARRLHRIFLKRDGGEPVPDSTLLTFADEILAANYTDPQYGPRKGDGGTAGRFEGEP